MVAINKFGETVLRPIQVTPRGGVVWCEWQTVVVQQDELES